MNHEPNLKEIQKLWHGTYTSYIIGFIASICLTLTSFYLVVSKYFSVQMLPYIIVGLALVQAIIQLLFFLHVGQEAKPKWETLVFYFMMTVLLIISVGSLWIMADLNARMMPDMGGTHD